MKSSLQTQVPENFASADRGTEQRVPRARTRERGPPSALAEFSIVVSNKKILNKTLHLDKCIVKLCFFANFAKVLLQ